MTQVLPALPRGLRGLRPTGALWTALRLHRIALWVWIAVVLATTVLLLWLYGPGADAAARHLARCGSMDNCTDVGGGYGRYENLYLLTDAVIAAVPYAAALFVGGLCVGRELERGTAQLTWVQSITPTRWLATTVAVPAAWFLAGLVPLVTLHRLVWSSGPLPHAYPWYDPDVFATSGTLPFARVLLGIAVGALAGLLFRKALTGGLAGVPVLLVVGTLGLRYRESLWPTVTDHGLKALKPPSDAHALVHGAVTADGERITNNLACVDADSAHELGRCTSGFQDFWVTYHPSSHYWPLQLMETAIVLALTAAVTAAAFHTLRRRTP
ncbi:hypothetical protein GTY65_27640 [Streptomyces sp. SID8379]|uniref:hypothetical protein n=1 Tax=unclassified Streptomyces TaxID=2593676 RepID=UPI00036067FF|nr:MULTISPECIES: hypothetical protein [unclassified Streptomyces]MYW67817.1 hypothetical protein [Streptomyces sp. SID8379]